MAVTRVDRKDFKIFLHKSCLNFFLTDEAKDLDILQPVETKELYFTNLVYKICLSKTSFSSLFLEYIYIKEN